MPIVDDIEPAESCADTEREFQIKHRYTDAVLFEAEAETLRECVAAAVKADADLTSADLTYANLTSANLAYANLRYADFRYADLTSANLTYADLTSADLTSANLTYADLTSADLTSANLTSANLTSADLTSANLTSANLTSADLTSAIGPRVLSIGPIGSRNATLIAMIDDSGDIRVTTGYFRGTLAAFEAAVQSTHGDNEYGQHYRLAIALINAKLGGAA